MNLIVIYKIVETMNDMIEFTFTMNERRTMWLSYESNSDEIPL